MRLLLDNNLSPRLAPVLGAVGWDVIHVRTFDLQRAADEVMRAARDDDRILVSADTDFGALLARSGESSPSMVLVRRVAGRRVSDLAAILIANLPAVEEDLRAGSVVAIGEDSLRVRRLPLV